ncbi:uncharacterized protein [Coffea arabica]|uniref:Transposase (putative) gypsy type domain-containing protein n=1 Tax=Coffea arabica TaxID=13443 RepID=A0A6P6TWC5_COFAR
MVKTAKTHRETITPSYLTEVRPDPREEATTSSSEGSTPSSEKGSTEAGASGAASELESSEMSEGGSGVDYNEELGVETPHDEDALEPVAPKDLANIDFGKMPKFRSRIGRDRAVKVMNKYPFRSGYEIIPAGADDSAEKPPLGTVAIYVQQLEAGLRMPTSRFFRDLLRHFGVRITQLTPNAIRIIIGFEMLCRHQEVAPSVDLFCRCYTLKVHGTDKGWFFVSNRNNAIPKLVVGSPSSIKNWKRDFFFVSEVDFPRGFWWRPIKAKADPSAGDAKEEDFQKLMGSGFRIYSLDYPEAVLVDGGVSRALLSPDKTPFTSTKLKIPLTKLSDIVVSGSSEVAKRQKRKSSGETSAPPPKKKSQGPAAKTSAAKSTPTPVGQSSSATAATGSTSSVPEGVPLGVTTALPPHGRGKQLKPPVNAVSGTSLWNRFHSPPVFPGEEKTHSGEHWCPNWKLSVNDRCSHPRVAQELVMHSTLSRDLEFMKKLTPAEMVQSLMVTTASNSAFVAEMAHRYCAMVEEQDTGKLQNQISKLEKKLAVSESEKAELQRQLKEAEAKGEEAEVTMNSLKSALEEEQKRGEEVKKSHEQALNSVGASAVDAFRRSESFTKDLGQLLTPSFMFGFTSGVDAAAAHLSSEALESLKDNAHYNEDSKELCDRMAEGIQNGRNLAEIQDEFNKWLSELDEVFEEGQGEEAEVGLGEGTGEVSGGNIGEEHGEELHPGGEEAGEKAAQEGAEKGNGAETGV